MIYGKPTKELMKEFAKATQGRSSVWQSVGSKLVFRELSQNQARHRRYAHEGMSVNSTLRKHHPSTIIASPSDIGQLIRGARKRKGLSQQQFADLAGVGRRFVSELTADGFRVE